MIWRRPALLALTGLAVFGAEPALAADSCPNAAVRAQQGADFLPDCRAYEMVSPVDKNATDVQNVLRMGGDGESFAWQSLGAYAGTPGVNASANYVGRRTAGGWTTVPMNPRWTADNPPHGGSFVIPFFPGALSPVFMGTQGTFDPADQDDTFFGFGTEDVYTAASDGTTTWLSRGPDGMGNTPDARFIVQGVSEDGSTVFFKGPDRLTADAPDPPVAGYLYRWRNGELALVGRDAEGAVLPDGSKLGVGAADYSNNGSGNGGYAPDSLAVSEDGSSFVYASSEYTYLPGRLFLHRDGQATTELSLSRRDGEEGTQYTGTFLAASSSFDAILFYSDGSLTDEASPTGGYYRYDVADDELTFLVEADSPATFFSMGSVIATSDDLSHVYFINGRALAPGAVEGATNLYLDTSAGTTLVGVVSPSDNLFPNPNYRDTPNLRYDTATASADGETLAFESRAALTPDAIDGQPQVYRYDATDSQLECVSCDGATAGARLFISVGEIAVTAPRAVSADGRAVFFTTADSLVARDDNGKLDVYQHADGQLSLVSNGTSSRDAVLVDVSADGRDVFFITREALVAEDVDGGNRDIYDARAGGGFFTPPPPPPGCEGDACQPGTDGVPPVRPPASDGAPSGGNAEPAAPTRVRVRGLTTRQRAALASGRPVALAVRVSRAGRVTASLTTRRDGRTRRLATRSRRAARAGRVRLALRLTPAGRTVLARAGRLTATLTVRFAGRSVQRRVVLRADAGAGSSRTRSATRKGLR